MLLICADVGCLSSYNGLGNAISITEFAVFSNSTVSHNAAIKNNSTVEVGISNLVQLIIQLIELELDSSTVGGVIVSTVSGLGSQLLHSLQNGVCLLSSTLVSLDHVDTVLRVTNCLVQALDLRSHLLGDRKTCSVVACTVDTVAGSQLLGSLLQACYVSVQSVVRVDRVHVVLYYHSHSKNPP